MIGLVALIYFGNIGFQNLLGNVYLQGTYDKENQIFQVTRQCQSYAIPYMDENQNQLNLTLVAYECLQIPQG